MSFVPSTDTAQVNVVADGAGAGVTAAIPLGDRFAGISFTFEYGGVGTPAIEVLASNNAVASPTAAPSLAVALTIGNVYATTSRFSRYWVKVTGMTASDAFPLKVFVHRWP